jgi:hypothetical protein
MPYICIPPTVVKIQEENRVQQIRLQQSQTALEKYPQLCPQLSDPITRLQQIITTLRQSIQSQDELINQRIQLQTALDYPGFVPIPLVHANAPAAPIPDTIQIPSLINKISSAPVCVPSPRAELALVSGCYFVTSHFLNFAWLGHVR